MALNPTGDLWDLFQSIVDYESVSGNEAALADAVETALKQCAHLQVDRDGNCVIARTQLDRAQRVIIAGHLDTVPIEDNFPSRREDRDGQLVLWGRGTVDMKGGVAVALQLAAELTTPRHDVTWIFYDNEEVDSSLNGLTRLAKNRSDLLQGDFAILMEPTDAIIEGGCQGTARIRVDVEGKAAHSARSWRGVNAIHGLEDVLHRLNQWPGNEVDVDGLTYREGLNAVRVSGGVAGNVVPPAASVEVNYRFAPDKSADGAEAELRRIFDGYHVELLDMAPGARPGLDLPIAQEFLAATGGQVKPKLGWTDVARFSAMGMPALNYGPGDPMLAHAADEHCPFAHVDSCADGLRRWLQEA